MDIETVNSEDQPNVPELQSEVIALITAWADRGVSPRESAMVLAGMSHALLAKLGFGFGELVTMLSKSWKEHNGKF